MGELGGIIHDKNMIKFVRIPPHTRNEYCPQYSKSRLLCRILERKKITLLAKCGNTTIILFFNIYNFHSFFRSIYNMWGISPTLRWQKGVRRQKTGVKTHVALLVFDSRVASLTRSPHSFVLGEATWKTISIGLSFKMFG